MSNNFCYTTREKKKKKELEDRRSAWLAVGMLGDML
jgi:hypothetical protein